MSKSLFLEKETITFLNSELDALHTQQEKLFTTLNTLTESAKAIISNYTKNLDHETKLKKLELLDDTITQINETRQHITEIKLKIKKL